MKRAVRWVNMGAGAAITKGLCTMKAVKSLVVFMGVLLVLGLALLGYGMYSKSSRMVKPSAPVAASAPAPVAPVSVAVGPFSPVALGQPSGSVIAGMQWNGALLALHIKDGGLPDRVVVVNTANGSLSGEISLGQGEKAAVAPVAAPVAQ